MVKKRKKKIYNTPKKIKHKNKTNKIEEFIKSINNPRCDICQSIIALHIDRNYCGKCKISQHNNKLI